MQLGLLLTYRCNARCRHCCVSAGPELTDVMNEADVLSYVDQAAAIPLGPAALCLSGGEVLLYWDLVERILRHARGKFQTISLITNAFWATSPETARRKLVGVVPDLPGRVFQPLVSSAVFYSLSTSTSQLSFELGPMFGSWRM